MISRCTKFKVLNTFYAVVVFCLVNFFLYRFFSVPNTKVVDRLSRDGADQTGPHAGDSILSHPARQALENAASSLSGPGTGLLVNGSGYLPGSTALKTVSKPLQLNASQSGGKATVSTRLKTGGGYHVSTPRLPVNGTLPLCPIIPPKLNGPLATYSHAVSFENIAQDNPGLQPGGRYKPPNCVARHRVAIVIPYRNREEHLQILLNNLHPMLIRQQLDYGIFVVDQALPTRFNRAMLMNIGYSEAMKRYDYQCAVFHDVDLIPENDRNIYSCPEMPRHLSAAIDKFRYRLPYAGIYGGVSAVKKEQFEKLNGFSNMFFGWGGEDDDMSSRIRSKGFKISRYPMDIARYRMIKHTGDKGNERNPQRHNLLKSTSKRMATDGLNSLKYTVQEVDAQPTHLRLLVFIDEKDILKT